MNPSPQEFHAASLQYMQESLEQKHLTMTEIIVSPTTIQASYADPVTRKYAADENWVKDQIDSLTYESLMSKLPHMNQCSIGNLAYIALFVQKQELREKASNLLKFIRIYVKVSRKSRELLQFDKQEDFLDQRNQTKKEELLAWAQTEFGGEDWNWFSGIMDDICKE